MTLQVGDKDFRIIECGSVWDKQHSRLEPYKLSKKKYY